MMLLFYFNVILGYVAFRKIFNNYDRQTSLGSLQTSRHLGFAGAAGSERKRRSCRESSCHMPCLLGQKRDRYLVAVVEVNSSTEYRSIEEEVIASRYPIFAS